MKTIISVTVGIAMFAAMYLASSFCCASFNIADWNEPTRYFVGIVGFVISLFAYLFTFFNYLENKAQIRSL